MDKSFWHNSFFTLYGHRIASQQKRCLKKTAQVCFPYKAVNAPLACCLSSPGVPPLNLYNKKQEKMQMRYIKKTCVLNEKKPKQNSCVHMLSFWHRLWMWLNANRGLCGTKSNTWECGGGMTFGGGLIEAESSLMSQPALLPTYYPSAVGLQLPLFPAVWSLHTSEAKKNGE